MNSSELHRRLLYCGYDQVSEYTNHSDTNRFIYKQLLEIRPKYDIKTASVEIFNELYYQRLRVICDRNPAEDVQYRYLEEEKAWLKESSAALLVLCYLWAFLNKSKRNLSFGVECFIHELEPLICDCDYFQYGEDLLNYMVKERRGPGIIEYLTCPIELIPMRIDLEYHTSMSVLDKIKTSVSIPVESSAKDFNPWRKVTDGFSEDSIIFYVRLYHTREEQLQLLERIKRACTKKEYEANEKFFRFLKESILEGEYVPLSGGYSHRNHRYAVKQDNCVEDDLQELNARCSTININTAQQVNIHPQQVINKKIDEDS